MAPSNRNHIEIAVEIKISDERAVMMLVSAINQVGSPTSTGTIEVFEQDEPRQ